MGFPVWRRAISRLAASAPSSALAERKCSRRVWSMAGCHFVPVWPVAVFRIAPWRAFRGHRPIRNSTRGAPHRKDRRATIASANRDRRIARRQPAAAVRANGPGSWSASASRARRSGSRTAAMVGEVSARRVRAAAGSLTIRPRARRRHVRLRPGVVAAADGKSSGLGFFPRARSFSAGTEPIFLPVGWLIDALVYIISVIGSYDSRFKHATDLCRRGFRQHGKMRPTRAGAGNSRRRSSGQPTRQPSPDAGAAVGCRSLPPRSPGGCYPRMVPRLRRRR